MPSLHSKKSLNDVPATTLSGAAVALRADFNVPVSGGEVADDTRIRRALPTIRRLAAAGARVAVLSHLGRPGGMPAPALTLAPVSRRLSDLLGGRPEGVGFVPHASGEAVAAAVARLAPGDVLLLENTRFLPGETANAQTLAEQWSSWADHFVTDAFGTAHRAHASTDALPRAVRAKGGEAVAGELVEREMAFLSRALDAPARPFVVALGGAKISDKIELVEALLARADVVLAGGAMANVFFRALGLETGTSLVEEGAVHAARRLLDMAGPRLALPVDCVAAVRAEPGAKTRVVARTELGAGESIVDIGPVTAKLYGRRIAKAGTVVWNGPMGMFELDGFGAGTANVGLAAASAAQRGATVIVGGGDSAAAAEFAGVAARVTHVSTGGGAALEFLAGKDMPGLVALSDRFPSAEKTP